MLTEFPENLHRYRPADTDYFDDELKRALNGEVFLSCAAVLNDPFDLRPAYNPSALREVLKVVKEIYGRRPMISKDRYQEISGVALSRKEFRAKAAKMRPSVATAKLEIELNRKVFKELPLKSRLACFSEDEQNIPMWAHYAGNHTGVCLSYSVNVEKLNPYDDLIPFKVNYQSERPQLTTVDLINFTRNKKAKDLGLLSPDLVMDAMYLRKSKHWEYEREWRVFDTEDNEPRYRKLVGLELERVSLGVRAKPATVDLVKSIVGNRVPIVQMVARRHEFGFDDEYVQLHG